MGNKTALQDLNENYALPGQLCFKCHGGDLVVAEVSNSQADATIALQGGQILNWVPHGQKPVLWLSPRASFVAGKPIRGGIPVCWPWFGAHTTRPSLPSHGFARTEIWRIQETRAVDDGRTHIVLRMTVGESDVLSWPCPSELEIAVTVGRHLELGLTTRNTGKEIFTITQALHTYFKVADVRHAVVRGLEGCRYIDKVDGNRRKRQLGSVTIGSETDRIYLDSLDNCLLEDPGLQRRIRIDKSGCHSTVVWNPWCDKAREMSDVGEDAYLDMLCVESANAADDRVSLAPAGEHCLRVKYHIESL